MEADFYLKDLTTQSGETIMASSQGIGLLDHTAKQGHVFGEQQEWVHERVQPKSK